MPPALNSDFFVFVFQPQPSLLGRLGAALGLARKPDAIEFADLLTVLQRTEPADSSSYGGAANPDGDDDTAEGEGDDELAQLMDCPPPDVSWGGGQATTARVSDRRLPDFAGRRQRGVDAESERARSV